MPARIRNVCICGRHSECGRPLPAPLAEASRGIVIFTSLRDISRGSHAHGVSTASDKLLSFDTNRTESTVCDRYGNSVDTHAPTNMHAIARACWNLSTNLNKRTNEQTNDKRRTATNDDYLGGGGSAAAGRA